MKKRSLMMVVVATARVSNAAVSVSNKFNNGGDGVSSLFDSLSPTPLTSAGPPSTHSSDGGFIGGQHYGGSGSGELLLSSGVEDGSPSAAERRNLLFGSHRWTNVDKLEPNVTWNGHEGVFLDRSQLEDLKKEQEVTAASKKWYQKSSSKGGEDVADSLESALVLDDLEREAADIEEIKHSLPGHTWFHNAKVKGKEYLAAKEAMAREREAVLAAETLEENTSPRRTFMDLFYSKPKPAAELASPPVLPSAERRKWIDYLRHSQVPEVEIEVATSPDLTPVQKKRVMDYFRWHRVPVETDIEVVAEDMTPSQKERLKMWFKRKQSPLPSEIELEVAEEELDPVQKKKLIDYLRLKRDSRASEGELQSVAPILSETQRRRFFDYFGRSSHPEVEMEIAASPSLTAPQKKRIMDYFKSTPSSIEPSRAEVESLSRDLNPSQKKQLQIWFNRKFRSSPSQLEVETLASEVTPSRRRKFENMLKRKSSKGLAISEADITDVAPELTVSQRKRLHDYFRRSSKPDVELEVLASNELSPIQKHKVLEWFKSISHHNVPNEKELSDVVEENQLTPSQIRRLKSWIQRKTAVFPPEELELMEIDNSLSPTHKKSLMDHFRRYPNRAPSVAELEIMTPEMPKSHRSTFMSYLKRSPDPQVELEVITSPDLTVSQKKRFLDWLHTFGHRPPTVSEQEFLDEGLTKSQKKSLKQWLHRRQKAAVEIPRNEVEMIEKKPPSFFDRFKRKQTAPLENVEAEIIEEEMKSRRRQFGDYFRRKASPSIDEEMLEVESLSTAPSLPEKKRLIDYFRKRQYVDEPEIVEEIIESDMSLPRRNKWNWFKKERELEVEPQAVPPVKSKFWFFNRKAAEEEVKEELLSEDELHSSSANSLTAHEQRAKLEAAMRLKFKNWMHRHQALPTATGEHSAGELEAQYFKSQKEAARAAKALARTQNKVDKVRTKMERHQVFAETSPTYNAKAVQNAQQSTGEYELMQSQLAREALSTAKLQEQTSELAAQWAAEIRRAADVMGSEALGRQKLGSSEGVDPLLKKMYEEYLKMSKKADKAETIMVTEQERTAVAAAAAARLFGEEAEIKMSRSKLTEDKLMVREAKESKKEAKQIRKWAQEQIALAKVKAEWLAEKSSSTHRLHLTGPAAEVAAVAEVRLDELSSTAKSDEEMKKAQREAEKAAKLLEKEAKKQQKLAEAEARKFKNDIKRQREELDVDFDKPLVGASGNVMVGSSVISTPVPSMMNTNMALTGKLSYRQEHPAESEFRFKQGSAGESIFLGSRPIGGFRFGGRPLEDFPVDEFHGIEYKGPAPALSRLFFSNIPTQKLPVIDTAKGMYNVQLFANEPVVIGAFSPDLNTYADSHPLMAEAGGVDRHDFTIFRAHGKVGDEIRHTIYLSNLDRSKVGKYEIVGKLVQSTSPKLASLVVSEGRLDPPFAPSKYVYFVRVPETARVVEFALEGLNDRETICSVDGHQVIVGRGKFTAKVPPVRFDQASFTLECSGADRSELVRYYFTFVRQEGFSTLLKSLDAFGATVSPPFDPFYAGPYRANLLQGTKRDGGADLEWSQIRAIPRNPRASVSVEGVTLSGLDHLSPWYRIPIGETRSFRIAVRTPENPVAEEYWLWLSRDSPSLHWWEKSYWWSRIGNLVGLISTSVSAVGGSGGDFVHNAKFLQTADVSGRYLGVPELYQAYCEGFDPYNYQYILPGVGVTSGFDPMLLANDGHTYMNHTSSYLGFANGEFVTPYRFQLISSDVSKMAEEGASNLLTALWETQSGPTSSSSLQSAPMRYSDFITALLEVESDNIKMLEFNPETGNWDGEFVDYSGVVDNRDIQRRALEAVIDESIFNSNPRRLLALTPVERVDVILRCEASRAASRNLARHAQTLVIGSGILGGLGGVYGLAWLLFLRDSNSIFEIRKDFPKILHPARLWTVIFDLATISFSQAAFGMFSIPDGLFASVNLWGFVVPVSYLKMIAMGTVCVVPVAYICYIAYILASIRPEMVYSKTLCKYTDGECVESRAYYDSHWFRYLPLIRHLLRIEIRSVLPIASPSKRIVSDISGEEVFEESVRLDDDISSMFNLPWMSASPVNLTESLSEGRRGDMSYYNSSSQLLNQSNMEDRRVDNSNIESLALDLDTRCLKVAVNDDKYLPPPESNRPFYDNLNSEVFVKYPEAKVGNTNFRVNNSYDVTLPVIADLELQHISQLIQIKKQLGLHVPETHLQFKHYDRWRSVLSKADRGNFYFWLIDRVAVLSALGAMAFWKDTSGGLYSLLLFACLTGFVSISSLPSAVSAGATEWTRLMEHKRVTQAVRAVRAEEKLDETFSVWPFSEPGMPAQFERLKIRKDNRAWFGTYGMLKTMVFNPCLSVWYSPFWETRLWLTLKRIGKGPCGTEALKMDMMALALIGNRMRQYGQYGNWCAWTAAIDSIVALTFLNWDSGVAAYYNIKDWWTELWPTECEKVARVVGALYDYTSLPDRMTFYLNETLKLVQGVPVSFHYPKSSGAVRDCHVKKVNMITTELGFHQVGRVLPPRESRMLNFLVDPNASKLRARTEMYKTLVTRSVGAHRPGLFSTLPIQIPFRQFYTSDRPLMLQDEMKGERLVGTVQIANYGLRAAQAGVKQNRDHSGDSFLSLYANPKFFPAVGKIKLRKSGHNHSIRYEPKLHQLVIRGPFITEGSRYTIKTAKRGPPRPDMYNTNSSADSDSGRSSDHVERGVAQARCVSPGVLHVSVNPGMAPDLYRPIELLCPNQAQLIIDPDEVQVIYDPAGRDMLIRSRDIFEHPGFYEVAWTPRARSVIPVEASAVAAGSGFLRVPLSQPGTPDLRNWLVLRDEDGAVVDIDPRQTDAYQILPTEPQVGGIQGLMRKVSSKVEHAVHFLTGRRSALGLTEEPVPCTVIQCVNPVEKVYRLDPNFNELHRVLAARVGVLQAQLAALEGSSVSSTLWSMFMSMGEYAAFWRRFGLDILRDDGEFIDPLAPEIMNELPSTQVGSSIYDDHSSTRDNTPIQSPHRTQVNYDYKIVAEGEAHLKAELAQRIQQRLNDLQLSLSQLRVWIRGYNDPDLYMAQNERDKSDWTMRSDAEIDAESNRLRELKAAYVKQSPSFTYPMNVTALNIVKKTNFNAQFAEWQAILEAWLVAEEGVEEPLAPEVRKTVEQIAYEIMQALKFCLYRTESPERGVYRSILHYVVGSHLIRGPPAPWRPDPITAHPALIRAWPVDHETQQIDFSARDDWLPCSLVLTGNSIKVLMPNEDDAERHDEWLEGSYPWERVTGYRIPLRAFQRMELSVDPNMVGDDRRKGMQAKLTLWKDQRVFVDDAYVKDVQCDEFMNVISFSSDDGGVDQYHLLIGKEIPRDEAYKFPQVDVDPTIPGPNVNVCPLQFMFNTAYFERWDKAIKMARMFEPHDYQFDGSIPVATEAPIEIIQEQQQPVIVPPTVLEPVVYEEPAPILPEPTPMSPQETSSDSDIENYLVPQVPEVQEPSMAETRESYQSKYETELVGKYEGGFKDYRFHGKGTLYDVSGKPVYSGDWVNGRRHGQGKCPIIDEYGLEWLYVGQFIDDEIAGEGTLILNETDAEALRDKGQLPEYIYRMIRFSGMIAPPAGVRSQSFEMTKDLPTISPALMYQLFEESPGDGREGTYENKELVISLRAALSAMGDEDIQSQTLKEFDELYAHPDRLNSEMLNEFRSTDGSMVESAQGNAASLMMLCNRYMPYKLKWLRNTMDPNLGVSSVFGRLGNGTRMYASGRYYQGETLNMMPNGVGEMYDPQTGMRYKGRFEMGAPTDYGVMEFGDGASRTDYYGNLVMGQRAGHAVQTSHGGNVYIEGEWGGDKLMDGNTVFTINPEFARKHEIPLASFAGTLMDGVPNGQEKMTIVFTDGLKYSGGFKDGRRHGYGTVSDGEGKVIYNGTFEDDIPHGRCTRWLFDDGRIYIGDVRAGMRCGMGELYGPKNNLVYEGLWQNDLPWGRGTYYASDGVYDGEWQKGRRHGKGRFVYSKDPCANGKPRVYEGDWQQDVQHGLGSYLAESGVQNVYQFTSGAFIAASTEKYKPTCGKVPDTGKGPACEKSGFKPNANESYWSGNKGLSAKSFRVLLDSAYVDSSFNFMLNDRDRRIKHTDDIVFQRVQFPDRPNTPEMAALMAIGTPVPGGKSVGTSSSHSSSVRGVETSTVKQTGSTSLPGVSARNRAVIKLVVHAGKDLKKTDHMNKMDPYIKVNYGPMNKKGKVIKSGGQNPKFDSTFVFPLALEVNSAMQVEVWDKDRIGSDDLVGQAELPLRVLLGDRNSYVGPVNLVKPNKKGVNEPVGTLNITLEISEAPIEMIATTSSMSSVGSAAAMRGPHVVVTIHSVGNLNKESKHIDPFVKMTMGGKVRTTAVGKGVNAVYDETFVMVYDKQMKILFEVYDKDSIGKDDLVGSADFDLLGNPQFSGNLMLTKKGENVGTIDVSVLLKAVV